MKLIAPCPGCEEVPFDPEHDLDWLAKSILVVETNL